MKTKTTLTTLLATGALCLSPASANAQTINVRSLGGVHGPPSLSGYSPDYGGFRDNRGVQMLATIQSNSATDVGTAYQISHLEPMAYRKMVTTPNVESWHGALAPVSNQHGTMRYYGFYVYVTSGTFVPAQVDIHTQSLIWNGSDWVVGGGADNHTTLASVHSARVRMDAGPDGNMGTGDDTKSDTQNGNIASKGFMFFGPPVGFQAYSPGTSQANIDDAVSWMRSVRLKIRYTITVPATTGTQVFVFEDGPEETSEPAPSSDITDLRINSGLVYTLTWTSNGKVTVMQKSPDLQTWSNTSIWYKPQGEAFEIPTTDKTAGEPRYFYRLKDL